jgi:hypothetical protein
MKKKLENIKSWYLLLAGFFAVIIAIFTFMHNTLNKYDEVLATIKTTQQMSLKSVIWNDNIPLAERSSACDVYLNAGYNSLTKKHCQIILEEGISNGSF